MYERVFRPRCLYETMKSFEPKTTRRTLLKYTDFLSRNPEAYLETVPENKSLNKQLYQLYLSVKSNISDIFMLYVKIGIHHDPNTKA